MSRPDKPIETMSEYLRQREGAVWSAADTTKVLVHISSIEAGYQELMRRMNEKINERIVRLEKLLQEERGIPWNKETSQ